MTNMRQRFSDRGNSSILEKKFIARVLEIEGRQIIDEQSKTIDKHGLIRDRLMRERRGFRVNEAGSFFAGNLEIYFVKYLRFHDMKRRILKHASDKRKSTKRIRSYKLYNPIVFGRLNAIASRLMFGFTEEVKNELAQEHNIPS